MFRVNRQTDYAVRVVLALAKKPQGTRLPTSEIGREMLIPPSLLQRIVAEVWRIRSTMARSPFAVSRRP